MITTRDVGDYGAQRILDLRYQSVFIQEKTLCIWEERKKVDKDFGKEDPFAAYSEACVTAAQRYPDFDPEEKQLGVIVWENAVARISLSRELFTGPYDERWGCENGHQLIVFRGEKLAELT